MGASQGADFEHISIHALLAESDLLILSSSISIPIFLSTLSLRRATHIFTYSRQYVLYFYPRSPCGERLVKAHGDGVFTRFLSTLSLRRATVGTSQVFQRIAISIHALLAESDVSAELRVFPVDHFYPRSPCGERLWVLRKVPILGIFLSTLSLRRATDTLTDDVSTGGISIHALLAESDRERASIKPIFGISIHALLAESDS